MTVRVLHVATYQFVCDWCSDATRGSEDYLELLKEARVNFWEIGGTATVHKRPSYSVCGTCCKALAVRLFYALSQQEDKKARETSNELTCVRNSSTQH